MRSYLHVWRSKRYTIWGRESILYFIIRRPWRLILNNRLPNNTKVRTVLWSDYNLHSLFSSKDRERKDKCWDRHGANIAIHWKELYGEGLFRLPKKDFRERLSLFRRSFYQKWIRLMLIQGKSKFLFENHVMCSKIYRLTCLHAQGLLWIWHRVMVSKFSKTNHIIRRGITQLNRVSFLCVS